MPFAVVLVWRQVKQILRLVRHAWLHGSFRLSLSWRRWFRNRRPYNTINQPIETNRKTNLDALPFSKPSFLRSDDIGNDSSGHAPSKQCCRCNTQTRGRASREIRANATNAKKQKETKREREREKRNVDKACGGRLQVGESNGRRLGK